MTAEVGGLSPLKRARRAKIVTAARERFVADGFRATTMEGIAAAARMSKVTLYGYFTDKDAVFLAVTEALAAEIEEAVTAELGAGRPAPACVAAALVAKHALVARVVRGSPHAAELFAAKNRTAARVFAELDGRIEEQIAATLNDPDAEDTARLLFASAQGIANHVASAEKREADIRRVVAAVLARDGA